MSESGERAAASENERDRRAERRLIPRAIFALVVVAAFVVVREIFFR